MSNYELNYVYSIQYRSGISNGPDDDYCWNVYRTACFWICSFVGVNPKWCFVLPSNCGLVRVDIWATAQQIFRVYCKCRHLDSQQISVHNVSVNIIIQKGRLKKKKRRFIHTTYKPFFLTICCKLPAQVNWAWALNPGSCPLGLRPKVKNAGYNLWACLVMVLELLVILSLYILMFGS